MTSAKQIGVEPVISAHEMADQEVDHLGVMAYAAWFEHLRPRKPVVIAAPPSPPVQVIRPRTPTPPPPAIPPAQMISLVANQTDTSIAQPVSYIKTSTAQPVI